MIEKGVNMMPARKREPRTEAQYYTIAEISIILGLGQTKVRDLIKREHLPTVTFGRAIRVPIDKFATWREQRTSSAGNEERAI
jgi:excisionase family DNA binding protein